MERKEKLNRWQAAVSLLLCLAIVAVVGTVTFDRRSPTWSTRLMRLSFEHFRSLEAIVTRSDAVVVGRVLKTKGLVQIRSGGNMAMDYMVSEVEVLEVASGSNLAAGDVITVKQGVEDENAYHLSKGEEAILFLGDHRARTDIAPFVPINRVQGVLSRGNVVRKANLTSVSDVKNTLGVEGFSFDEIWKQVVEFASEKE